MLQHGSSLPYRPGYVLLFVLDSLDRRAGDQLSLGVRIILQAALHTARFKKKGTSMLDFLVSSGADVNCTTDQVSICCDERLHSLMSARLGYCR